MIWKKVFFDTVTSTNTLAKEYPFYTVITAKKQTLGRGRYGKSWVSCDGNLYMSIVIAVDDNAHFMAFVIGVALAQALNDFNPTLKWPNDVLINGKKTAGILIEIEDDKLIFGIGVNVAGAPENTPYPVTSLNNALTLNDVQDKILTALSTNLEILKTQGFEPIRATWLAYAHNLGQEIRVNLPHESITGIFKTITPLGALDLELNNQTHRIITAGDVFFIKKENENE